MIDVPEDPSEATLAYYLSQEVRSMMCTVADTLGPDVCTMRRTAALGATASKSCALRTSKYAHFLIPSCLNSKGVCPLIRARICSVRRMQRIAISGLRLSAGLALSSKQA